MTRRLIVVLMVGVLWLLSACTPIAPGLAPTSAPSAPSAEEAGLQIGLVLSPAEGDETALIVSLTDTEEANALDVLNASGLPLALATTDFGPAICAILEVGQPAEDCFGDPEGRYWAFFFLTDANEWEAAPVGVDGYLVQDGQVLGFAWTGSDANYNPLRLPPVMTFANIAAQ